MFEMYSGMLLAGNQLQISKIIIQLISVLVVNDHSIRDWPVSAFPN